MDQRTITGATDTPTTADNNKLLVLDRSGAGDCTITLDTDANQTWSKGDMLGFHAHDGVITISPATGVNVDGSNSDRVVPEGQQLVLVNADGGNEWTALGDLLTPATTQSATTYTLAASDHNSLILLSNASAVTVTVPTNASVEIPVGFRVALQSTGAGGATLSTTGITLNGSSPNTTIAQNEAMWLEKTATDTWTVLGATAA